ncbi:MAG: Flp pilus assembly protein CpaB, partial [Thermotaleaceae bacterium]
MKNKPLIFIVISIILAVITFSGIFMYVTSINQKVMVVTAGKNIAPYTEITEDDLVLEEKSQFNLPQMTTSNLQMVAGMYTGEIGLFEGDIITQPKVRTKEEVMDYILSKEVTTGKRAVAVEVDLVRSAGNFIQPNSYVDVSVVSDEFEVTPIESIKVLSVKDRNGNDLRSAEEEVAIAGVVVFEAAPEERDVIIKISDRGRVHLSLRSKEDITETTIDHDAVRKLEDMPRNSQNTT